MGMAAGVHSFFLWIVKVIGKAATCALKGVFTEWIPSYQVSRRPFNCVPSQRVYARPSKIPDHCVFDCVKTNLSLINREAGKYFPWDERICRLDLCPVGSNRPQEPHCCIQTGEHLPLSGLIFCLTNISISVWTKDDLKKKNNTWNSGRNDRPLPLETPHTLTIKFSKREATTWLLAMILWQCGIKCFQLLFIRSHP